MKIQNILLYVAASVATVYLYENWISPKQISYADISQTPYLENIGGSILKINTDKASFDIDMKTSRVIKSSLYDFKAYLGNEKNIQILDNLNNNPLISVVGIDGDEKEIFVTEFWDEKHGGSLKSFFANGLVVEKIYKPSTDGYSLDIKINVSNHGSENIETKFVMGYVGQKKFDLNQTMPSADMFVAGIDDNASSSWFSSGTFSGLSYHNDQKPYNKVTYSNLAKKGLDKNVTEPWLSLQQRYFLTALIPSFDRAYNINGSWTEGFLLDKKVQRLSCFVNSLPFVLSPGETTTQTVKLYTGPQDAKILKNIAPGLDLTVDFGIFWFVCDSLLWVLEKINLLTNNWGWSIIFMTVFLRGLFFKSSEKGFVSAIKIKELAPKITKIQETYKDDEAKKSSEILALYRKEKVNPLSFYFTAILPIPIMMGLYYVLLGSIELRHAPFLWLADLSAPDPFYILPIVMVAVMYAQTLLSPVDESMQSAAFVMPAMIGIMSSQIPSGLALFYFFNTLLSVLQQWWFVKNHGKK